MQPLHLIEAVSCVSPEMLLLFPTEPQHSATCYVHL